MIKKMMFTAVASLCRIWLVSSEKHGRVVATNNPPTEEEITGVAAVDPDLPAWVIDGMIPLDNGEIWVVEKAH